MYKPILFQRSLIYSSWSIKLLHPEDGRYYWVDVWVNDKYRDVDCDWNQYIFHLDNVEDCLRSEHQNKPEEFDEATSVAIQYLLDQEELIQDDHASWFCLIKEIDW